jgi:hypothetical protein
MGKRMKIPVQKVKTCVAVRGTVLPIGLARPTVTGTFLPIGTTVGVFASSELYLWDFCFFLFEASQSENIFSSFNCTIRVGRVPTNPTHIGIFAPFYCKNKFA